MACGLCAPNKKNIGLRNYAIGDKLWDISGVNRCRLTP